MSASQTINVRPGTRELASRERDGVHVVLLWQPADDALSVSVDDARNGHSFEITVERDRGLDAFYHPFAYAAGRNLCLSDALCESLNLRQQV